MILASEALAQRPQTRLLGGLNRFHQEGGGRLGCLTRASRSGYDCYVELARLTFKDIRSCQVEAHLRRASSGMTGEGNGVPPY